MFDVEHESKQYHVFFKHDIVPGIHTTARGPEIHGADRTICRIISVKAGVEDEVDIVRHINDRPNRNVARKFALTKLLRKCFPTEKATRAKFWQAYWFALRDGLPMTVDELLESLKNVPGDTWVYLRSRRCGGAAKRIHKNLGANEPFVLIEA